MLHSQADVQVAMLVDDANGGHQLHGGKRLQSQLTPPRLLRPLAEADRDDSASPATAHSDSFIRYFARTVVALPEGTTGPETV